MPWLAATALLHSSIVVEKRNALKIWTVLLSILAFSLSLIGTFLVRSGVLTSVHAFAVDPARGLFILAILCGLIGGSLALFAWRAPKIEPGGLFAPISREGALVINNLFLATAAACVFVGTLYPLALETLTGAKISVGPPFFNLTFVPIVAPLLLLVPVGPVLSWKRADAVAVIQRLWFAASLSLACGIAVAAFTQRGPWLAPFGLALGAWLMIGSIAGLIDRIGWPRAEFATSLARLRGLPRSSLGTLLAHFGLGVMIIGIVAVTAWRQEIVAAMKPGDRVTIAGYNVTFESEAPRTGPNYLAESGRFLVSSRGAIDTLVSEKRVFQPGNQPTTEAGIRPFLWGDLYIVMGDPAPGGGRVVRIYFNPLVSCIWLGAAIMFLGGALSLSDRRFRIGAPRRRRSLSVEPAE
jgi:cytochrome c-type biogenesis protein CcmF